MSATVALAPARYKDRLKIMRAETVTAWMAAAFGWAVEALRSPPVEYVRDEEAAARKRWYGAFY